MSFAPIERRDIVYGLTNTTMPGLVKIGRTSRELQVRVAELHTTGVPQPFDVAVAYRVDDGAVIEQALHRAFRPYRISDRREFFRIESYQVEAILALLGTDARGQDVTALVAQEPTLIPNETIVRSSRRPNADYVHMGLQLGDTITFTQADAIATIAGRRVIEHEGEITSLTAATHCLLPGTSFGNAYTLWQWRGETLMKLYDRIYPR